SSMCGWWLPRSEESPSSGPNECGRQPPRRPRRPRPRVGVVISGATSRGPDRSPRKRARSRRAVPEPPQSGPASESIVRRQSPPVQITSDGPAPREAGVDAVIPVDVGIAFEPAPQDRIAVAFTREVQQQRGESLHLYAVGGEVLQVGEEARLQGL